MTPRLHSWPTLLQALVLVISPRLGLRQQGNKGVQTHENPTNANENNAIKGKEPRTIIGTPTKDVVAQTTKDNRLKEKVQKTKDSPIK